MTILSGRKDTPWRLKLLSAAPARRSRRPSARCGSSAFSRACRKASATKTSRLRRAFRGRGCGRSFAPRRPEETRRPITGVCRLRDSCRRCGFSRGTWRTAKPGPFPRSSNCSIGLTATAPPTAFFSRRRSRILSSGQAAGWAPGASKQPTPLLSERGAIQLRRKRLEMSQALEKAEYGNGEVLSDLVMDLGSAPIGLGPAPLAFGVLRCWRHDRQAKRGIDRRGCFGVALNRKSRCIPLERLVSESRMAPWRASPSGGTAWRRAAVPDRPLYKRS